jgi:GDP-4-dehydro-6-deoxy-D-mannose reductase
VSGPILITGASGFVGSHLIELLQPGPTPIVAAFHPPGPDSPPFVPPRLTRSASGSDVRWEGVDVLDRRAVDRVMADVKPDVVYHCAGAAHVGTSWHGVARTHELNVMGTRHVLEAVRRLAPGARVLVPGSATVYRRSTEPLSEEAPIGPGSPYGLSKLAQELLATSAHATDNLQVIVTRSFNHLGPRQSHSFASSSFARQVAAIEAGFQPPIIRVGNLEPRRDFMDVRDTVRAYRLLVEGGRPGVPYNVCSGQAHSVGELLRSLVAAADIRVRIETDEKLFRPNDDPIVLGNPARIRTETGWSAGIPLDRTLRELLDYWRAAVRAEPKQA